MKVHDCAQNDPVGDQRRLRSGCIRSISSSFDVRIVVSVSLSYVYLSCFVLLFVVLSLLNKVSLSLPIEPEIILKFSGHFFFEMLFFLII
jgi:hypothetical protein